jgi:hypothetical protein
MPTQVSTQNSVQDNMPNYPITSIAIIGESATGKSYSINSLKCSRVIFNLDPKGYEAYRFDYHDLAPSQLAFEGNAILADPTANIVIDYSTTFSSISPTVTVAQTGFENMFRNFVTDANAVPHLPSSTAIVLDGLTGMSRLVLTTVCALNRRAKPIFEDWGQTISKITEIVQAFVSMNKLFIMITHVQTDKDEITGRVKEQPLIYGRRLPEELLALFSTKFRTGASKGKFFWYTNPQPLFASIGSRCFDNLPEMIEQNFDSFLLGKTQAVSLRT